MPGGRQTLRNLGRNIDTKLTNKVAVTPITGSPSSSGASGESAAVFEIALFFPQWADSPHWRRRRNV